MIAETRDLFLMDTLEMTKIVNSFSIFLKRMALPLFLHLFIPSQRLRRVKRKKKIKKI
jgi:hypothetical protein